ncbi:MULTISPECIES: Rieske (2Fe-2S) protein [Legionella]|uniref:Rieske (2Fe-2S) protein n=1 Tax=Legionella septentrionalis TaxID=2498109 RepID=A0A3S0XI14_9GAMM|nr:MULTISPECIES: Rieske (2Fe-2S) protein [Legionella]MCP0913129.1 Rieske (2Fe-2S) protein [Legionella sp. 27cVA30]RUQ91578.1 Rieske (2Fe-2S) protein [Legionella septentrionalis]RUR02485.1 Rieske (2Fe-2S) protein [Legionella septentrionalis]RUR10628.1 Rieske (2Fe-2S) protein [Legionella septentrionalis]RUR17143.1 Rieske (2Fe-2S) protein [Legionella septentrionalis]
MAWLPALPLIELQQKKRQKLTLNNQGILLLWHQEEVHAIQSQCPHLKLPLLKGELTDDCAIVCPFHKSAFHLKTGESACWSPWPPVVGKLLGKVSKEKPLKIYSTQIKDDVIWVNA